MREPGGCLLVTAAGTAAGQGILLSARAALGASVRLVAGDINPPHLLPGAALADVTLQLPPLADAGFEPALHAALGAHGVTDWWPLLDAEVVLAAALRETGGLPAGLRVHAPGRAVAETCLDKLAVARTLAGAGLPAARTWEAAAAPWAERGLVVKPRRGHGSHGVRLAATRDDLARAVEQGPPDAVAQERLDPPEVTIDAFRPAAGRTRAVARERLEVKAGVCVKARVHADAELEELTDRVAGALGLRGAFCWQAMRAPDGGWRVTDVNPRPGGGARMSAAVGFDTAAAALVEARGDDPAPYLEPPERARFVVRRWVEEVH
jgi:biotin carboxylase